MLPQKIGWVSLNSVSKKMFEFNSDVFRRFKDHFFKVKATSVISEGLSLMHEENEEPCFPFYWQSDHARFKSFEEGLMSLKERVDRAILEQFPALLDARAIFSLPSTSNPLLVLHGKMPCLSFFGVCLNITLSFLIVCYVFVCLYRNNGRIRIMTLVKQVGPTEGDVTPPPTSVNEPSIEEGYLTEVGVNLPHASGSVEANFVEVIPDVPPSATRKRKHSGRRDQTT